MNYLTVDEWLKRYNKVPLFRIETNTNPLILELLFRIECGYCYQPYCLSDGTLWVYCKVEDFNNKPLKTRQEIQNEELFYYAHHKSHWKEKELNRSKITQKSYQLKEHQLKIILKNPEYKKKHERLMEQYTPKWHKAIPHKENPIRIHLAGCDDSSYTQVVESQEKALEIIEIWKECGIPEENPEEEGKGLIFTN